MILFKRSLLFAIVSLTLSVSSAYAMRNSGHSADGGKIRMVVMAGPSAFSVAGLDEDKYEIDILRSPSDAAARLLGSWADFAILPPNMCFTLIQNGSGIGMLAVTAEGGMSIVGKQDDASPLFVPQKGSVPDFLARLLRPEMKLDYSYPSPLQLASMLIENKVGIAILPEPYVSMALKRNPGLKTLGDLQNEYGVETGHDNFPVSVLVVRRESLWENVDALRGIIKDMEDAYIFASANPDAVAEKVSRFGFMSKDDALDAALSCNLCFYSGEDARCQIEAFYKVVRELEPSLFPSENMSGMIVLDDMEASVM